MEIKKIKAVYFSPTGSTAKVINEMAGELAAKLNVGIEKIDFTLPENRNMNPKVFNENELVVFGVPTYAGRIPNKILPAVKAMFKGSRTPAVAAVTFGNRDYGSSLTELAEELGNNGFCVFAAAAIVCEHAFTDKVGNGRPDCEDFLGIARFSEYITEKIVEVMTPEELAMPLIRNGEQIAPYYTPLKADGTPASFLKAKPETDTDKCTGCRICAETCPMGSINPEDTCEVTGICIKCHACIKKCPAGAKYFTDADFLSHVKMIENNFAARANNEFFA